MLIGRQRVGDAEERKIFRSVTVPIAFHNRADGAALDGLLDESDGRRNSRPRSATNKIARLQSARIGADASKSSHVAVATDEQPLRKFGDL